LDFRRLSQQCTGGFFFSGAAMHISLPAERAWIMVLIQLEQNRIAQQTEGIGGA
jgi:hypothetical protein